MGSLALRPGDSLTILYDGFVSRLHPIRFLLGCDPSRVGGGALARWPPSAAQTARAGFPHAAFTKTHNSEMQAKDNIRVGLSYTRPIETSLHYPRTMTYGFFAKRTDPPSSSLTHLAARLSLPVFACHLPRPLWSPITRSRGFHRASGSIWQSDYWQNIAHHFAFAYRLTYSGATQRLCQFS